MGAGFRVSAIHLVREQRSMRVTRDSGSKIPWNQTHTPTDGMKLHVCDCRAEGDQRRGEGIRHPEPAIHRLPASATGNTQQRTSRKSNLFPVPFRHPTLNKFLTSVVSGGATAGRSRTSRHGSTFFWSLSWNRS